MRRSLLAVAVALMAAPDAQSPDGGSLIGRVKLKAVGVKTRARQLASSDAR